MKGLFKGFFFYHLFSVSPEGLGNANLAEAGFGRQQTLGIHHSHHISPYWQHLMPPKKPALSPYTRHRPVPAGIPSLTPKTHSTLSPKTNSTQDPGKTHRDTPNSILREGTCPVHPDHFTYLSTVICSVNTQTRKHRGGATKTYICLRVLSCGRIEIVPPCYTSVITAHFCYTWLLSQGHCTTQTTKS